MWQLCLHVAAFVPTTWHIGRQQQTPTWHIGRQQQTPMLLQNLRTGDSSVLRMVADEAEATAFEAPAAVLYRQPSPVLQPREVISTMLSALHRSSWDEPRPYFGFEVALRFLAPTHQVAGATPRDFQRYLRQPHKEKLLQWGEYRWDGELTIIDKEAFQQVSVRSGPDAEWTSVRWLLCRVDAGDTPHTCWMVDGVFVEEPDDYSELPDWEPGTGGGRNLMHPLEESEMRAAFDQIDSDGSGRCVWLVWHSSLWARVSSPPAGVSFALLRPYDSLPFACAHTLIHQGELSYTFRSLRYRSIDHNELAAAVSQLGIARSEDELAAVVTAVDDDSSGEIEFDEFKSLLTKVNSECHTGKFAADLTNSVRELETSGSVVEKVRRTPMNVACACACALFRCSLCRASSLGT